MLKKSNLQIGYAWLESSQFVQKSVFVSALLFTFVVITPAQGLEWWGKEVTSLKYVMPSEGLAHVPLEGKDLFYLGLKGYGVDVVTFQKQTLKREQTFRFEELIDPSVGLQSILPYKDFLLVGGIFEGFLAIDLAKGYPSDSSRRHRIVFSPDAETIVYSALLKAIPWKSYLLFLTADQLILGEMNSASEFNIRSSLSLAPAPTEWQSYWATDMVLQGDDLYILLAHQEHPFLLHLSLTEALDQVIPEYAPLPEKRFYLKALRVIDDQLYVAQNRSLLIYQIGGRRTLEWKESLHFRFFIQSIISMPGGIGLSFWENGFGFFKDADFSKERSILYPPKQFVNVSLRDDLLFASAGVDGLVAFQKYPDHQH